MEERVSLILVTVFYLVVFLCGLVGNLLVCIVIARSKCLHSAMNYYLISLALADLILLILGKNSEYSQTLLQLSAFLPQQSGWKCLRVQC